MKPITTEQEYWDDWNALQIALARHSDCLRDYHNLPKETRESVTEVSVANNARKGAIEVHESLIRLNMQRLQIQNAALQSAYGQHS